MRIHKRLRLLVVGVAVVLVGMLPVRAVAIELIDTTPTDFLAETPLQITGYGWGSETSGGSNYRVLRYIQLYNNSDSLINLSSWSLEVQPLDDTGKAVCLPGDCLSLQLPSQETGLLAPNRHIIIDDGSTVADAVAGVPDIAVREFVKSKISVQFVLSSPGYQTTIIQPKIDTIVDTAANYFWSRNLSSTGSGYVTGFTVGTTPPVTLFNDGLYTAPPSQTDIRVVEVYSYASDCPPEDVTVTCGDYIKLYVGNTHSDVVDKIVLRTSSGGEGRTNSNTFPLAGLPDMDGYMTVSKNETGTKLSLTNSGGYVWLEDTYGLERYGESIEYPSATSTQQGSSYILTDDGNWVWTTTPRPDAPNKLTLPVPALTAVCPEGKYLNPDTNRCRTIEEAVNELAACPEGQERNPTTNRCRSKVSTTSTTLTPCNEGQERNPATNRCRSIASAVAELLPCDEGYERNPTTNRCRKVLAAATTSASKTEGAEKQPVVDKASSNVLAWSILGVVIVTGVGYGIYEWREELAASADKLLLRLGKK